MTVIRTGTATMIETDVIATKIEIVSGTDGNLVRFFTLACPDLE
jgi:hypothetical protein